MTRTIRPADMETLTLSQFLGILKTIDAIANS